MISPTEIQPGPGRSILVVVAHADDPALFLGGTILCWSDAGWRVVCVRVTDDRWVSVGLTVEDTVARNAEQFREAAAILGIADIVELDYPTDVLGDVSEVALREHIIRQIRTYKPYALVTFDPYARPGEDNQDHIKVAQARDKWASAMAWRPQKSFASSGLVVLKRGWSAMDSATRHPSASQRARSRSATDQ